MRSKKLSICLMIILALFNLPHLVAAGPTGAIRGTVTDKEDGNPIPGASVLIVGTSLGAMTNADGKYEIANVSEGTCTLKITAVAYSTVEIKAVRVVAKTATEVNVEMEKAMTELNKIIKVQTDRDVVDRFEVESGAAISKKGSNEKDKFMETPARNIAPSLKPCYPTPPVPPAHGGNAIVNGQRYDAMFFKDYGTNPFVDTEDDHLSTFAIDVDDASYVMAHSYLERGNLPPDEAIRTEEFINHFKYDYDPPESGPFVVYVDGGPSPFGQNCQLLRIGIKGEELDSESRKAANLVFVIDVSGSMARENRLELVKEALRILVGNLQADDKVGIVVFTTNARVVLGPTMAWHRESILRAIDGLYPQNSTNVEDGLRLGYDMAWRIFDSNRNNRIILCSDGVANVGLTSSDDLLNRIKGYADRGIYLTAVGVGMGNYNDVLLEQLGDKGNGHYAYVNNTEEARKIFMDNLSGTLQTIAKDVKIQVDFDSTAVRSYRLLGYENRDVADNQFRNDRVDGGEIGAGHQVTALYEIKLRRPLRSSTRVATIFIRYKDPQSGESDEIAGTVKGRDFESRFENCTDDFKLAAAAAEFAEILGKSYWARGSDLSQVYDMVREIRDENRNPELDEFLNLISKARRFEDQLSER